MQGQNGGVLSLTQGQTLPLTAIDPGVEASMSQSYERWYPFQREVHDILSEFLTNNTDVFNRLFLELDLCYTNNLDTLEGILRAALTSAEKGQRHVRREDFSSAAEYQVAVQDRRARIAKRFKEKVCRALTEFQEEWPEPVNEIERATLLAIEELLAEGVVIEAWDSFQGALEKRYDPRPLSQQMEELLSKNLYLCYDMDKLRILMRKNMPLRTSMALDILALMYDMRYEQHDPGETAIRFPPVCKTDLQVRPLCKTVIRFRLIQKIMEHIRTHDLPQPLQEQLRHYENVVKGLMD